jgi:sporulation protein YlmC with PRC-barrel domain
MLSFSRIVQGTLPNRCAAMVVAGLMIALMTPSQIMAEPSSKKIEPPSNTLRTDQPSRDRGQVLPGESKEASSAEESHLMPASKLIGCNVQDLEGKEIGEVKDFMIRQKENGIPFVVVSFAREGAPEKGVFAIPWKFLQHDYEKGVCLLTVQSAQKASSSKEKEWVELKENSQGEKAHSELGIGSYWLENASATEKAAGQEHFSEDISAKAALGAPVVDEAGADIGKIYELMIDLEGGRIAYSVLNSGGMLGVGGEKYSIPWEVLEYSKEKKSFMTTADKEKLKKAPQFQTDDDSAYLSRSWSEKVYQNFDLQPYWVGLKSWTSDTFGSRVATVENNPDLISGAHLIGASILDAKGEEIGAIENVAIDPQNGNIVLVLISCGGLLSNDGRLRACPFSALTFNSEKGAFQTSLSKDRFYEAPSFDKKDFPKLKDSEWSGRVRAFYGQGS